MYRDRKLAWGSYVDATRNVVDAANAVGAKVILVSTEWVFGGTQRDADETTPPLASESAEMMLRIIEHDKSGIFHCCGGERGNIRL